MKMAFRYRGDESIIWKKKPPTTSKAGDDGVCMLCKPPKVFINEYYRRKHMREVHGKE
jgi:hypothetical protein